MFHLMPGTVPSKATCILSVHYTPQDLLEYDVIHILNDWGLIVSPGSRHTKTTQDAYSNLDQYAKIVSLL